MGVTLKDWYDRDQVFDHDTFFVRDENGEIVQFSKGTGEPTLETLEVTENGTYTPSEGVDGFGSVEVNVPIPEVKLQDKTITENGEYSADVGFDGLGNVVVDVKGGGSLGAGIYLSKSAIDPPNTNRQRRFMYNGELYVGTGDIKGAGYLKYIYKWNGSSWGSVLSDTSSSYGLSNAHLDSTGFRIAEYNDKLHIFSDKYHAIFDGTTLVSSTALPGMTAYPVVYQDKLMVLCSYDNTLYEWDESSSTWTTVEIFSDSYISPVVVNGELYFYKSYKIYKYGDGTISELGNVYNDFTDNVVRNGNLYYVLNSWAHYGKVFKFDFATNTEKEVGQIPKFAQMFLTRGTNELSFAGVTVSNSNSKYVANYPFFDVTIMEG